MNAGCEACMAKISELLELRKTQKAFIAARIADQIKLTAELDALKVELASVNTEAKRVFTAEFKAELLERTQECDRLRAELAEAREALSRSQAECAMRHYHRGVAEKALTELREAAAALLVALDGEGIAAYETVIAATHVRELLAKVTP